MKTLQMNQKADYGNWVPAAMMKTLWMATAAIAIVAFQDTFGQKNLYGDMEAFCEELLQRYTEPSEEVRRSEAI